LGYDICDSLSSVYRLYFSYIVSFDFKIMANLNTSIEWTDATWSPVTGCSKVSSGCQKCYAERLFPRVYAKDKVTFAEDGFVKTRPRKFTDVKLHPDRLEQPFHWKKPRMIFVNSMSDLFHEDIPFEFIEKVWDTMFNCLAYKMGHIFQILTKRPERMLKFVFWMEETQNRNTNYENIWLGISCENQATADERIPLLLQVPAAVRFLSCEPLLDEIDLSKYFWSLQKGIIDPIRLPTYNIHQIIVGGESGPGYRPMNLDWARSIRDQCASAGVPFFFKQTAGKKAIPEDLQIREYPNGKDAKK